MSPRITSPLHLLKLFAVFILCSISGHAENIFAQEVYAKLRTAVQTGNLVEIERIRKLGIDFELASSLCVAIGAKQQRVVEYLIDHGVNPNRGPSHPLFCAAISNDRRTIDYLLAHGADINAQPNEFSYGQPPLVAAISQNRMDALLLLIEYGADVNVKEKGDWTPLYLAVDLNQIEFVKVLTKNGADPDFKNADGDSPRSLARRRLRLDIDAAFERSNAK